MIPMKPLVLLMYANNKRNKTQSYYHRFPLHNSSVYTFYFFKKNMAFLQLWEKGSYAAKFLMLFPCIYVLQPKLVHLYQSSSLIPCPLPIVASVRLRILYSFLYSEYISHIHIFGSPLVWSMSHNTAAFVLHLLSADEGEHAIFWPSEPNFT
jgi:hypothetical protein